jgi:hypothetical protein
MSSSEIGALECPTCGGAVPLREGPYAACTAPSKGATLELIAQWHGWFRLELSSEYGPAAEIEVSLAAR